MPNEDCELKIIQLTTQIETKDTEICDKESKIKELVLNFFIIFLTFRYNRYS